jgi:hypothetical protein
MKDILEIFNLKEKVEILNLLKGIYYDSKLNKYSYGLFGKNNLKTILHYN